MVFNFVAIYETFLEQRAHYDGSIIYDDLIADPKGKQGRIFQSGKN